MIPAALSACLLVLALVLGAAPAGKVRQPGVAGAFYPSDPNELTGMLDRFLAGTAAPEIKERVAALVSPHAGYIYSGGVAAQGYALLKGRKPDRVVVISPSHVDAFPFSAVYDGDAYATPLGNVPVDKAFASKLGSMGPHIRLSSRGHAVSRDRAEHALEVQLPFLQRVLGFFKVVPIVMGEQNYETSRALGLALAKLGRGSDTLIIASSDLSHFHSYEDAVKLDRKTLKAIQEWDYLSMSRNFEAQVWEACGGGPIIAAMIAAERLGAGQARLLKYANSGDATGDRSRVVGYASLAFVPSASSQAAKNGPFALTRAERDELMNIAKRSVEKVVKERRLYEAPAPASESLLQERGAFVTLKKKGVLRGCIGYVSPLKPLYQTVREVAVLAAVRDDRFPPVTAKELGELEYEISVLSPLRRVLDIKQIELGAHGLVVKKGEREGLLLPQVPVEQRWDKTTFLGETCRKAGLPERAWQDEDTDLFLFSALVFGDHGAAAISSKAGAAKR